MMTMRMMDVTEVTEAQLASWLFEFKLNGIIILRNFLPVDLIDAMNEQFRNFLSLEVEMDEKGTPLSGRGDNRYAVNVGGLVQQLGGPLNDPRARKNPVIEMLVGRIMGPWRYSNLIVETPCPGSDFMTWHGDMVRDDAALQALPKRTLSMKLQIPLVDVTEENGPIEIIPGSHRMHYIEGNAAVTGLANLFSARLLMKRGDCFLRDGDLIHRGTPNRSNAPRPLYSQTYKLVE
jgi:hypothetical protein